MFKYRLLFEQCPIKEHCESQMWIDRVYIEFGNVFQVHIIWKSSWAYYKCIYHFNSLWGTSGISKSYRFLNFFLQQMENLKNVNQCSHMHYLVHYLLHHLVIIWMSFSWASLNSQRLYCPKTSRQLVST